MRHTWKAIVKLNVLIDSTLPFRFNLNCSCSFFAILLPFFIYQPSGVFHAPGKKPDLQSDFAHTVLILKLPTFGRASRRTTQLVQLSKELIKSYYLHE